MRRLLLSVCCFMFFSTVVYSAYVTLGDAVVTEIHSCYLGTNNVSVNIATFDNGKKIGFGVSSLDDITFKYYNTLLVASLLSGKKMDVRYNNSSSAACGQSYDGYVWANSAMWLKLK